MRPTTTVSLILAAAAGAALFQVSFQVTALEGELRQANQNIQQDRQAMRVLRAEWSYLNQPAQLEDLAKRYLRLQPVETVQLGQVADVELRPEAIEDTGLLMVSLPGQPRLKPPAPARQGAVPSDTAPAAALPAVVPVAVRVAEPEPAVRATRGRDVPRSFDDVLADVLVDEDPDAAALRVANWRAGQQ